MLINIEKKLPQWSLLLNKQPQVKHLPIVVHEVIPQQFQDFTLALAELYQIPLCSAECLALCSINASACPG